MDKRIVDERFRKPRRAKGTPFFRQRNYYALGVLAVSGGCWYLYELWPETQKLRKAQIEGKFDYPDGLKTRIQHIQLGRTDATLDQLLAKAREREIAKHEEEPTQQSWISKIFSSSPDFSPKLDKISNYFEKLPEHEELSNTEDGAKPSQSTPSDSPYKNSLSEISSLSSDICDDDFKTKPLKKDLKPLLNRCKSFPVSKRRKTKKTQQKNTLIKMTSDNFKNEDVDPENLQMAIALSKSTYEAENGELNEIDFSNLYPTQVKIAKVKRTLEQFGFKSGKSKIETEFRRAEQVDSTKRRKKSKFHYVTPILYMRTAEERESLVTSKVSIILNQNKENIRPSTRKTVKLHSTLLQKLHVNENIFFCKASLNDGDSFYLEALNFTPTTFKCGSFLKDWSKIPGREITPPREVKEIIVTNKPDLVSNDIPEISTIAENNPATAEINNTIKSCEKNNRCVSPDLFDSEDETYSNPMSTSQRILPPSKSPVLLTNPSTKKSIKTPDCDIFESEATGIKHFKSFFRDSVKLSQEFYDLTKSSSEEEEKDEMDVKSNKGEVFDLTQSSKSLSNDSFKNSEENVERLNNLDDDDKDDLNYFATSYSAMETTENWTPKRLHTPKSRLLDNITNFSTKFEESFEDNKKNNSLNAEKSYNNEFECNTSKTLNITDYVERILNENEISSLSYHVPSENKIRPLETVSDTDEESSNTNDLNSQSLSQESICISDEELNYSSFHCKPKSQPNKTDAKDRKYYELSDDSDVNCNFADEKSPSIISENYREKNTTPILLRRIEELKGATPKSKASLTKTSLKDKTLSNQLENRITTPSVSISPIKKNPNLNYVEMETNSDKSDDDDSTPKHLIIRTKNVTPMTNYDEMDTPNIAKELNRFGLKPLKRQRGVKLLTYLYEYTHPIVGHDNLKGSSDEEETQRNVKKRKNNLKVDNSKLNMVNNIEIAGDSILEGENMEDLIFERKQSSKIHSCRVPLQIVWFNFVSSNPEITEQILLYEPLQLELLHSMLKEQGFKFHAEDILQFLDKKCITFRTNSWKGMNKKQNKGGTQK